MAGFGSIDDLMSKKGTAPAPATSTSNKKKPSEEASTYDDSTGGKLKKKMQDVALKEKEQQTILLAQQLSVAYIDLQKFPVNHEALRQVPGEMAKKLGAVCFFATQDEVRVGALNPTTQEVQDLLHQIRERLGANGGLYTISPASLDHVLNLYKTLPIVKAITKDVTINEEDLNKVQATVDNFKAMQALLDKASTTQLLTYIMGGAFKLNASDVHIEAEEEQIIIRFRLDGILHDVATIVREKYKQLVSRIKLLSSLKINISDKPQDGRFTIKLTQGDVDIRVSTIPTVYGESIVMRLLKQSRKGLSFDDLGLRGLAYERLKAEVNRPNGMIITTGPTGSGKTTTLYSIMQQLNKPEVKIITLEDPVEYRMEGINQSQIDHTKGYTFGGALRSVLRQDPDIAMVGEIRDLETAEIAIQAALTGHLILSTIHTNNASGTIPRFLSMGVKPFLLAPALNAVIGQRLVRRLCEDCKQPVELTEEQSKRVQEMFSNLPEQEKKDLEGKELKFLGPGTCDKCNNVGYKGRLGIYEIFAMTQEIEQMILGGQVSEYDIEQIAIKDGMVTMVQDGLLKALDGITSVEEVFRVIE